MIKKSCIIVLFLLCTVFVQAAPEIIFQKSEYQPQETIFAKIVNIEKTIPKENIRYYEDRREILITKDGVFYNNTYYFYFVPTKEGNFTLKVEGILYTEAEVLKSVNIEKNITVKKILDENNLTSILGINPGFISSINKNSEVYLTNYGTKTLDVKFDSRNVSVAPGKSSKVSLEAKKEFELIDFKTYSTFSLPVIYLEQQTNTSTNQTSVENTTSTKNYLLSTANNSVQIKTIIGETVNLTISIKNNGDTISKIDLENSNEFVKTSFTSQIAANASENLSLIIKTEKEGFFKDQISFFVEGKNVLNVSLEIYSFKNETKLESFENSTTVTTQSCSQIGGTICQGNQNCEGEFTNAGGLCCFGQCTTIASQTEKDPVQTVVGIIILCLVGYAAYFFYRKSKNNPNTSSTEIFKKIESKTKK